ncbi:TIGR02530 family flagellar biosynthesis protein [Evansella cellulosilytica]|uniref:Flagellar operon protein n=1 Tax=Evansella cellulosilytica (strain ATCC 21833 / DSM 2522 / FERM P-1141 / JCM 9156 / N-4) TaxID=649639 RepID=E6TSW0_EVAC2|nr:TIGR02530 family flagellar biosynthesis protein [Evansella cellulosilytica]ADU30752.1 flagellar operon protein [Evansella cellulosilytica DSM 2522]
MNHKIMPHHMQQLLHKPISKQKQVNKSDVSFQTILNQSLDQSSLKISKHAEKRLQERGIQIPSEKWDEIHSKVMEAQTKGVNDSLVLTNDIALVVSAKNETVITAMDRSEAQSQIFTNINGAILMD